MFDYQRIAETTSWVYRNTLGFSARVIGWVTEGTSRTPFFGSFLVVSCDCPSYSARKIPQKDLSWNLLHLNCQMNCYDAISTPSLDFSDKRIAYDILR